MYNTESTRLRRRLGSESETNEERSYVVTSRGSSFQVTQESLTPQSSPNPRAAKYSNGNLASSSR